MASTAAPPVPTAQDHRLPQAAGQGRRRGQGTAQRHATGEQQLTHLLVRTAGSDICCPTWPPPSFQRHPDTPEPTVEKRQRFVRKDVDLDLDHATAPGAVAKLSRPQREARALQLLDEAHAIVDWGIKHFITDEGKRIAGIVTLFSGGNDSTVLADVFRSRSTHAAARQHEGRDRGDAPVRARRVCEQWGLPLSSALPPARGGQLPHAGAHARLPGPWPACADVHAAPRSVPSSRYGVELCAATPTESESSTSPAAGARVGPPQRAGRLQPQGSIVWISPLINWTKPDMNTYRLMVAVKVRRRRARQHGRRPRAHEWRVPVRVVRALRRARGAERVVRPRLRRHQALEDELRPTPRTTSTRSCWPVRGSCRAHPHW